VRIALITDGIWPYVLGGMQKHSYYLAKYLAQKKAHVHLFHFNQSGYDIKHLEFFTEAERGFITSVIVPFPRLRRFPGHYLYASWLYSKKVVAILRPRLAEFDFIYTKGFTGWALLNERAAGKLKGAPIGLKFHGYEMFQPAATMKGKLEQAFLLRPVVKKLSRQADVVFSYGGKITNIIKQLGVPDKRVFELPSGVERDSLSAVVMPAGERIRFLFLGRYERRKGVEEIYGAIPRLNAEEKTRCEFHFVGPIPESKRTKESFVTYHGEVRDPVKLGELVRQCDVLLSPSFSEGMPNAILEAMSKGLAVACTDVGANTVVVTAETGWIIAEPSSAAIASAISAILSATVEEINLKKSRSLERIRNRFTWEDLAGKLYDKIAAESAKK
jgi:glycosyltransferase involved in cell wall biosynthesis